MELGGSTELIKNLRPAVRAAHRPMQLLQNPPPEARISLVELFLFASHGASEYIRPEFDSPPPISPKLFAGSCVALGRTGKLLTRPSSLARSEYAQSRDSAVSP